MSFTNLTPINLGMNGTFAGRSYRVVGRVVMGMEDAGETYYWNEFNLLGADGQFATLVHEVTEDGVRWRLFTLFEPKNPISVQEAAGKSVGDTINLDGRALNVTLADQSRVYFIEGQAPEGVEVGDVARYFNAELRNVMIVVSWTGDEVEFYRGLDLPRSAVAAGFGLGLDKLGANLPLSPTNSRPTATNWVPKLVIALVLLVPLLFWISSCPSSDQRARTMKPPTPPAPLAIGGTARLSSADWRIQGHALVEIAQVGLRYERHEYELAGDAAPARLVCDAKPGATDWLIYTPFQPATTLTPSQAAAKRLGDRLDFDNSVATLTGLFQSTVQRVESTTEPAWPPGAVLYGFTARSGTNLFLVRWNKDTITFQRGQPLTVKEVANAVSARRTK